MEETWLTQPKPCPFCGASAIVSATPDKNSRGVPNGAYHAHVACMGCGCETASFGGDSEEAAKARARKVWDERKYANSEWQTQESK